MVYGNELEIMLRNIVFFSFSTLVIGLNSASGARADAAQPNIVFILTDQWRADALGYAGDTNVHTPNIDRLAKESVNFYQAVSGCPVCCPFRASLLTGQRPLTHGIFLNDVQLPSKAVSIAEVLNKQGYETGYIGKWHLDGRGRSKFTPPERRQGFQFWRALECSHNYNKSFYYGDSPMKLQWEGYDALSQTREARRYITQMARVKKPFALFIGYGGPHNPYHTAPPQYQQMYDPVTIKLRPNVPKDKQDVARKDLAGYYAHCTALDDCVADLRATLKQSGVAENTIVVFTSDHGDMIYSHGKIRKQKPWDESLRVPMLFHFPAKLGQTAKRLSAPINSEDLMPTLLGLCNIEIPDTVEGLDYSAHMQGGENPSDGSTVITCPSPFGEWRRDRGGKEYRGIRNERYTYVRDLKGPWLLYDNQVDPYQQHNLVNDVRHKTLQEQLDATLKRKLRKQNDKFRPGQEYIQKWGYVINQKTGTVPYTN